MVKRVTSREVAVFAGVSPTAVSYLLNKLPGLRRSKQTHRWIFGAARLLSYLAHAVVQWKLWEGTGAHGLLMRYKPDQAFPYRLLPPLFEGNHPFAFLINFHLLVNLVPPEINSSVISDINTKQPVGDVILSGTQIHPPLTMVHPPAYGLGRGAADLLICIIKGETPIRDPHLLSETHLIDRTLHGAKRHPDVNYLPSPAVSRKDG